jgi:hypothetical protein
LNIEIVHRRSPSGDAEQISIHLQAMPSFEAFGRFLEDANPFVFWVQASRLAWLPWLEAARVALLPFGGAPVLPKAGSDARPMPCRSPAATGRRRCRMHGGAPGSGGPRRTRARRKSSAGA